MGVLEEAGEGAEGEELHDHPRRPLGAGGGEATGGGEGILVWGGTLRGAAIEGGFE